MVESAYGVYGLAFPLPSGLRSGEGLSGGTTITLAIVHACDMYDSASSPAGAATAAAIVTTETQLNGFLLLYAARLIHTHIHRLTLGPAPPRKAHAGCDTWGAGLARMVSPSSSRLPPSPGVHKCCRSATTGKSQNSIESGLAERLLSSSPAPLPHPTTFILARLP